MTTHRKRIEKILLHEIPDRTPVALWRHFPVDDQTAEGLAAATLAFQRIYDFDIVKVTPESSFCLKDWGAKDEWRGATEGTRTYTHRVIQHPDDWKKLQVLDPWNGYLGRQLKCLQLIKDDLGSDTPVIQTIFNPLSQAKNLVGEENLLVHLRKHPNELHAGLEIIMETTKKYVEALVQLGIDGTFFAVQHAQYGKFTPEEYEEFGKTYDLQILDNAQEMWLNLLHIHGTEIMFDMLANYPVQVVNWHDRETTPSLHEGLQIFDGVVCGGISRQKTIVLGSPDDVYSEATEAIQSTRGERFILGTGCVVPINAPYGNILAAKNSVIRGM